MFMFLSANFNFCSLGHSPCFICVWVGIMLLQLFFTWTMTVKVTFCKPRLVVLVEFLEVAGQRWRFHLCARFHGGLGGWDHCTLGLGKFCSAWKTLEKLLAVPVEPKRKWKHRFWPPTKNRLLGSPTQVFVQKPGALGCSYASDLPGCEENPAMHGRDQERGSTAAVKHR